jgi:hypothetical protein
MALLQRSSGSDHNPCVARLSSESTGIVGISSDPLEDQSVHLRSRNKLRNPSTCAHRTHASCCTWKNTLTCEYHQGLIHPKVGMKRQHVINYILRLIRTVISVDIRTQDEIKDIMTCHLYPGYVSHEGLRAMRPLACIILILKVVTTFVVTKRLCTNRCNHGGSAHARVQHFP